MFLETIFIRFIGTDKLNNTKNFNFLHLFHSAGVGRTGTFICIDNLLQLAAEENIVDVFNYVNYMRTRRIHMVQTEVG